MIIFAIENCIMAQCCHEKPVMHLKNVCLIRHLVNTIHKTIFYWPVYWQCFVSKWIEIFGICVLTLSTAHSLLTSSTAVCGPQVRN